MDTIRVRCRSCGKEVEGRSGKTISCGCPNMVTVFGDRISATDIGQVIMLSPRREQKESHFTREDIEWQESRKNRKIRKMDFEIR